MSIFNRLRGVDAAGEATPSEARPVEARPGVIGQIMRLPRWAKGIIGFLVFALLYWGIGGAIMSDTRADLSLRPGVEFLPAGGSVAVGMAAMLIDHAVNEKGWTPNDGPLRPTALLEDMPAFQRGQHGVLLSFAMALNEAADGDPELADAANALKTPPERAFFHGSFPFVGGSAESRYRDAIEALSRYNRALADSGAGAGDARMLRLGVASVDRSLSTAQSAIDSMVDGSDTAGTGLDARYHHARGAAHAAALILRGLRDDHGVIIRERQLAGAWAEAIEALDAVATRAPFGIGRAELVEQGYFLLRARNAMRALGSGGMQ